MGATLGFQADGAPLGASGSELSLQCEAARGAAKSKKAATELQPAARRVHEPRRRLPALHLMFEQVVQAPASFFSTMVIPAPVQAEEHRIAHEARPRGGELESVESV